MATRASGAGRLVPWFGTSAALVWLVGATACAPIEPRPPPTADHVLEVVFQAGCPHDVRPVQSSQPSCGPAKPRCIRVRNGEVVLFRSAPAGLDFELQFDPFKKAPLRSGHGQLQLPVSVHLAQAGTSKEFPFNVLAGTCTPLDPQIIVEW